MEKEAEEERMRRQRAAAEKAFQDGITKAKLVMRRTPLGTDRNHNRSVLLTVVERLYTDKCTFFLNELQLIPNIGLLDVFLSDTGCSLTWFLVCTLRKAGYTKASSTASLLHHLRTNQLSLR